MPNNGNLQAKPFKICAITTVQCTMELFVVPSMRNLYENGFAVSLICNMDNDFVSRNKDFAVCYPVRMKRGIDPAGFAGSIVALYRIFRREKFDIIQYSTPNAALYASIAGAMAGIPIRVYGQWGIRYMGLSGLRRAFFRFLEKLTCRFSTHVRAQSPKNMGVAIMEGLCRPEKISVVGIGGTIGVDMSEFDLLHKADYRRRIRSELCIPEDAFVFGFAGRLNADKGINELLEAYRSVSSQCKGTKLLLVGDEDMGNPIRRDLLHWAKESGSIVLAGHVPAMNVCKYMAAFDIMVHPTHREGFGKVLQEGMAMALPIITTDVPGPSEVVVDGVSGVLVPANDPYALSMEMIRLMEDEGRIRLLSENARTRAETCFARPVMLKNILTDFRSILCGAESC